MSTSLNDIPQAIPELPPPKEPIRSSTDEILEIEREIAQHERLVIELKVKRNSCLPISRLPVEVLCTIFRRTQDAWSWAKYSTYASRDNLRWISLTHVCKQWRDAALNDPSLWTQPPLNRRRWATLMLERSRMAGLRLAIDHRSDLQPHFISVLSSHSHHIEEFSIMGLPRRTIEELLGTFGTTHMPMLQNLTVDGQEYSSSYSSVIGLPLRPDPRIRKNHFVGSENLRRLSLISIAIDWSSDIFSSLTCLSIARLTDSARPSPSQFLDILAMMANLTSLFLYDALPRADDPTRSGRRIPLPTLQKLVTTSNASECEFFWNNISTSDNLVDVNCGTVFNPGTTSSLSTFLSAIYAAYPTGHLETNTRHVFISAVGQAFDQLSIRVTNQIFESLDIDNISTQPSQISAKSFEFNIQLVHPQSASSTLGDRPGDVIFTDLFNSMRWGRLSNLDLTGLPLTPNGFSQALSRTFGSLAGVETVTTGQHSSRPLIEALLTGPNEDTSISIVFPGLRRLQFSGVDFDSPQREARLGLLGLDYDRLRQCLLNRRERNARIVAILITDCRNFGEKNCRQLQEIEVSVDWDGRGENYFEELAGYEAAREYYFDKGYGIPDDWDI